MPSPAVIATQLTDHSSRTYTLCVGGLDLNVTGQSGAAFMVPIESISVDEQGPGGISGMDFDLWDPNREISLSQMAEVRFHDVTNDDPQFRGFVQSWSVSGLVGRTISVHCIGIEAMLDWLIVPSLTIPVDTSVPAAVCAAYANATGVSYPLRALSTDFPDGTIAFPVGDLSTASSPFTYARLSAAVTLTAVTLREALETIFANSVRSNTLSGSDERMPGALATVDFWSGLLVWRKESNPGSYSDLTVTDAVSGTAATVISHETDGAGIPRGVFVQGGNAAGTGLVPDGTGIPGPVAVLSDSSITTAAARDAAGMAYLDDKDVATRGSLQVEAYTPSTRIHAGSNVTITNNAVGLSAATYKIASIGKRWQTATKEVWMVAYGGLRPSAMRLYRRFTRDKLS